ncbi:MAG: subclass B1 metallo-beta-lactamase [Firmicutes bacterium]|uniref:Beta-lactamase n=1 Tax=Melghirimyces thermohalophilus TaxID=1236220 RepID=A0A1G6K3C9_9BACL|nr:subclass B1 metallo-beta-lactamase [Melghirimyces thermohalophilus]MDA8353013.1 subclass B1 metallo-beta-lactamase [Bacillota bacterium]SDC25371.1 metallo-beta-lactamase class B [Melghirimyces thermohalophilus]
MKTSKGWIGKVVVSLLLTLSVAMPSFHYQTMAQSNQSSPTPITNPEKTIVLTKLNDKVWAHTSYNEWNGTTYDHKGLIILTSKGVVLIDTAWDTVDNYQKTEELLKMIKKHLKKKVVLALVTHAHDDSIGGIQALLNQGIDVRSTHLTAKLAKEYGYPSPNPTLDVNPVMKVGDTVVESFYPGEGHSQDNITVWLPQYKLLFGGCLIKSLDAKDLGNLSDANVEQWDDSVKKVIDRYPHVKTVVPGHGDWGNKSLLYHTIALIKQHKK